MRCKLRLYLKLTGDCEILSDVGDLLDHDHDCNFLVAGCKPGQNDRLFRIHSTSLSCQFGKLFRPDSAHEPFPHESSHHKRFFRPSHGKRLLHPVNLQREWRQIRADFGPPRHREGVRIFQTHARVRPWSHCFPDFRRKLSTFGTEMQELGGESKQRLTNYNEVKMKPDIPWSFWMHKKIPDKRYLASRPKMADRRGLSI